jgi:hypothetical protein
MIVIRMSETLDTPHRAQLDGYIITVFIDGGWFGSVMFAHDGWGICHITLDSRLTWCGCLWAIKTATRWQINTGRYLPEDLRTGERLCAALQRAKSPKNNRYARSLARSRTYRQGTYPTSVEIFLGLVAVDRYSLRVTAGEVWLTYLELSYGKKGVKVALFNSKLNWYAVLEIVADPRVGWHPSLEGASLPEFLDSREAFNACVRWLPAPRGSQFEWNFMRGRY